MKKAIALISAAVLIFTAAGCKNKQPDPEQTTGETVTDENVSEPGATVQNSPEESTEESTEKEETPPSSTMVVVVTGGKEYGIEQPDVTSVVELVPTIAPQKPRPTAPERTTKAKPTTTKRVTTTRQPIVIPTPEGDPELVYADLFSVTENGATDSIAVINHTCEYFAERGTFGITVNFDIKAYSGTRKNMYVAYNCYDKSGKKLNDKQLSCYVPLSGENKTVQGLLSARADTVKIELVSYY